jgi:hypothetical protein
MISRVFILLILLYVSALRFHSSTSAEEIDEDRDRGRALSESAQGEAEGVVNAHRRPGQINVFNNAAANSLAPMSKVEVIPRIKDPNNLRFIVYVIYHDDASKMTVTAFTSKHSWAKPLYIKTTKYLESIVYRDYLPFLYDNWAELDYVGLMSYKATNITLGPYPGPGHYHFEGSTIPDRLRQSAKQGYDVVPFLRTNMTLMNQAIASHTDHFKTVWDLLLYRMGFPDYILRRGDFSEPFFRNAFAARPQWLVRLIRFMNDAIEVSSMQNSVLKEFEKDATYENQPGKLSERPKTIFGTEFWQYYPFVFERLPPFFYNVSGASVCGPPICPNFWETLTLADLLRERNESVNSI